MEMERFAEVQKALADRTDVQVLSWNVDEETGTFRAFMLTRSLPFPTMAAYHYAKELMDFVSVPRIWIVSTAGKIVWEKSGFDLKAKSFDDVVRRIPQPVVEEG